MERASHADPDELSLRLKAKVRALGLGVDSHKRVAVLYVRVSKEDKRGGRGATLEAQEERLRQYAEAMGFAVEAVFRDEGVSGGVPFHEREGGRAARELFLRGSCSLKKGQKRGAPAHLIAAKLDRLGRETRDILGLVPEYQSAGIAIHTADEGGKLENLAENENAEFLLTVRAAAAAMEKRKISTRTKAVLAHKRKLGLRTGHIPYGYKLAADGKHLEENPVEQPALREIQQSFDANRRLREEQRALDAMLEETEEEKRDAYSAAFRSSWRRHLGLADSAALPEWVERILAQDLEDGVPCEAERAILESMAPERPAYVGDGDDDPTLEARLAAYEGELEFLREHTLAPAHKLDEHLKRLEDAFKRAREIRSKRLAVTKAKVASGAYAVAARLNSNPTLYPKRTGALWVPEDVDAIQRRLARAA